MTDDDKASFWIRTPWKDYPVRIWRPKNPAHGDLTTDIAFVLAQIGKDAHERTKA